MYVGSLVRARVYLMMIADDVTCTFNNIIPMNMLLNIFFLLFFWFKSTKLFTFHFYVDEIGQQRKKLTFCYDKSGRHSHTNLWSVVKSPRELTKKETREFSPKFRRWVNASFLYPFGANSGDYWFFLLKRASCYQFLLCGNYWLLSLLDGWNKNQSIIERLLLVVVGLEGSL